MQKWPVQMARNFNSRTINFLLSQLKDKNFCELDLSGLSFLETESPEYNLGNTGEPNKQLTF